jgi:pimeloyl-ACP methyl ester carboxylesterase
LGWSWGAVCGPVITAIEDRLKTSILRQGVMFGRNRPEIDPINYIGRVTIPTLMLNGRYDMAIPFDQYVKPMFELLGAPSGQKELKIYDTDHTIPTAEFIKETLRWLDKYLGPVKSNIQTGRAGTSLK